MNRLESPPDLRPFELIVAGPAWETALRSLLLAPDHFAVGSLRWNADSDIRELLADRLEVVRELPSGPEWPPLADWCVLTIAGQAEAFSPETLIVRLQPRASQVLVVIVLSAGDRRL